MRSVLSQLPAWNLPLPRAVLYLLLTLLLLGALTFDRSAWPSFMGDEATYIMQAASLAGDLDLDYSADDYRRFVETWKHKPQGLILQSGDGGSRITYGKPFFYAFYLAPFVRLAPVKGPFVANALLLAFTCVFVASRLERRLGPAAPLWLAALVFGSVSFAFTFWVHADLFLMCLTALALALVFERQENRGAAASWMVAGALLAMVGFSRPFYLTLFVPVLFALPRPRRRALAGLAIAAAVVLVTAGSVHRGLTGSWTPYGATRTGFYNHTGYPDVDFPREEWARAVEEQGNSAALSAGQMLRAKKMTPALWAWNSVYFFAGRQVGLLPYFFPVVLAFAGRPRGWARWALLAAVAAAAAVFLYSRPFNFYGGGGTLANRYFLPLYPALWFLPTWRMKPRWIVAAAVVAGLFVGHLWLRPRTFPVARDGTYDYVTPAAEWLLPFETTQSHLKLAGKEDLYGDFFIRFLSPEFKVGRDGFLRLPGAVRGTLMLASIRPLAAVDLEVRASARVEVDFDGRTERPGDSDRVQRIRLHLGRPRARHPTWWSWKRVHVYQLTFAFRGVPADQLVAFEVKRAQP